MARGWRDRVAVEVEVGYRGAAAGGGEWDVTDWDEGTWSGIEPTFEALSGAEVVAFSTSRGRPAAYARFPTGTAAVELAWPTPAGGQWSFKPTAPIAIGQEIRLSARVDDGPRIPIFRGSVRSVRDTFELDGPFRVSVRLIERKADLARVNLPEGALVGLGDTTSERLSRINELAGIASFYERFEAGGIEHQSSNFARNLLDEAELTVESEGGEFYVDREGFLAYVRRGYWLVDELRDPPLPRSWEAQAEWSNVVDRPLLVAPSSDVVTEQLLDDVVNQASFARAGGAAITASDADSILRFGLATHQRFDLNARFDADVTALGELWVEQLKEQTERLGALSATLNPNAPAAELERYLDVELLDRHDVIWDDETGDVFAGGYHVQSVSHQAPAEGTWSIGVTLWRYVGAPGPIIGSAWGTARWGDDVWE